MLGRREKHPVLAEVPAPRGGASRRGALGRAELDVYAGLAAALVGSRVVLVTGPDKSKAALGLAAAATAAGRRIALLEGDLVSPRLAGFLGIAAGPGLDEYLRGEVEAPEILQSLVLAGPASGLATEPLACIVAGEPEAAPATLLGSERCRHAVEKLGRAYDLLVIDGPPIGPDPEPLKALGGLADTIVACGRRGEIPRRPPVPLTGVVLFA